MWKQAKRHFTYDYKTMYYLLEGDFQEEIVIDDCENSFNFLVSWSFFLSNENKGRFTPLFSCGKLILSVPFLLRELYIILVCVCTHMRIFVCVYTGRSCLSLSKDDTQRKYASENGTKYLLLHAIPCLWSVLSPVLPSTCIEYTLISQQTQFSLYPTESL